MTVRRLVGLLLVPAVLLGACGGDDHDPAVASDTSTTAGGASAHLACPDAGTIGDIVGAPSKPPDETRLPDGVQCTYRVEDAPAGIFGVVNIRRYDDGVDAALETFKAVAADAESVDVPEADEAWWAPSVTNLFVVRGRAAADILLSGLGEGVAARAMAIELAEPALA